MQRLSAQLDQDVRTLDPGAVAALCGLLDGDDEALAELVGEMLDEAPQRLADLRGDPATAGRAAHTLKSNALTFGALDFAALCRQLEAAAREGAPDGEAIERIEREWPRVRRALLALAAGARP